MVFKTLHWYISRELLRIFVLTASVLTTLLAFGGTFKEVTKKGVEASQLMTIMTNLMPAMLAYTIPIAALFAAVLVYWRLSTDNELTACRASGISFVAIVMPSLFLGVVMASTDLLFVNYAVPMFLHRAEQAVYADLGSMLVSQIGKQESFSPPGMPYVIYANSATLEPSSEPNTTVVKLDGMAALVLKNNKPDRVVVARQAWINIHDARDGSGLRLSAKVVEGTTLIPRKNFQKASGSVNSELFPGGTYTLPSLVKSKPKFANRQTLRDYQTDPTLYPPVNESIEKIRGLMSTHQAGEQLLKQWNDGGGRPMSFSVDAYSPSGVDEVRIQARAAKLNDEKQMTWCGTKEDPVRVQQYARGQLRSTYTCQVATMLLVLGDFPLKELNVSLQLTGDVKQNSHERRTGDMEKGDIELPGVVLPSSVTGSVSTVSTKTTQLSSVEEALRSDVAPLMNLGKDAFKRMEGLRKTIDAELHSRASFAVACLTLVLLGAALGILMRGQNPLAVFVVGFVPAIILVLLITAGRHVTSNSPTTGLVLIWLGNAIILVMVMGVYSKLLRH